MDPEEAPVETLPDDSAVFAIVMPDDPVSVTGLIIIRNDDTGPEVFLRSGGEWTGPDPDLLTKLQGVDPPKLQSIGTLSDSYVKDVIAQIDASEGIVAATANRSTSRRKMTADQAMAVRNNKILNKTNAPKEPKDYDLDGYIYEGTDKVRKKSNQVKLSTGPFAAKAKADGKGGKGGSTSGDKKDTKKDAEKSKAKAEKKQRLAELKQKRRELVEEGQVPKGFRRATSDDRARLGIPDDWDPVVVSKNPDRSTQAIGVDDSGNAKELNKSEVKRMVAKKKRIAEGAKKKRDQEMAEKRAAEQAKQEVLDEIRSFFRKELAKFQLAERAYGGGNAFVASAAQELVALVSDAGLIYHVGRVSDGHLELLDPSSGEYTSALIADCSLVKVDQQWHDELLADLAELGPGGAVLLASSDTTSKITLPDGSKKFAVVLVDDPEAVTDLIALAAGPKVYVWQENAWVESPELLGKLTSITPPKLVTLTDDMASNVAEQISMNENMVAAAHNFQRQAVLEALVAAPTLTAGLGHSPRGAENLREYWVHGKGALKIKWGAPGDWKRCVRQLSKYLGPRAKGYCALRHKEATGMWTAQHAKVASAEPMTAAGQRRVRTPEGAEFYHQPIGSIIVRKTYLPAAQVEGWALEKGSVIDDPESPGTKLGITKVSKSGKQVQIDAVDVETGDPVSRSITGKDSIQTYSEETEGVKARISMDELDAEELSAETTNPESNAAAVDVSKQELALPANDSRTLLSMFRAAFKAVKDKDPQYHFDGVVKGSRAEAMERATRALSEVNPNDLPENYRPFSTLSLEDSKTELSNNLPLSGDTLSKLTNATSHEEIGDILADAIETGEIHPKQVPDVFKAPSLLPHLRADGTLTPEREELHRRILQHYFQSSGPLDKYKTLAESKVPPSDRKPRYTMVGGGPASGKGSLEPRDDGTGYSPVSRDIFENQVYVNPDDIKDLLPESLGKWSDDAEERRGNPTFVHEESSFISKELLRMAEEMKYDIYHDAPNNKAGKTKDRIVQMMRDGFDVEWHGVTADAQTTTQRAITRGVGKGERFMPTEAVWDTQRQSAEGIPEFLDMPGLRATLWDTDSGWPPKNLYDSERGGITDEAGYQRFLKRADISKDDLDWTALDSLIALSDSLSAEIKPSDVQSLVDAKKLDLSSPAAAITSWRNLRDTPK